MTPRRRTARTSGTENRKTSRPRCSAAACRTNTNGVSPPPRSPLRRLANARFSPTALRRESRGTTDASPMAPPGGAAASRAPRVRPAGASAIWALGAPAGAIGGDATSRPTTANVVSTTSYAASSAASFARPTPWCTSTRMFADLLTLLSSSRCHCLSTDVGHTTSVPPAGFSLPSSLTPSFPRRASEVAAARRRGGGGFAAMSAMALNVLPGPGRPRASPPAGSSPRLLCGASMTPRASGGAAAAWRAWSPGSSETAPRPPRRVSRRAPTLREPSRSPPPCSPPSRRSWWARARTRTRSDKRRRRPPGRPACPA